MARILLVNHGLTEKCGVWAHGERIARILEKSEKHEFKSIHCDSKWDLVPFGRHAFGGDSFDVVIYNYHPSTLAWAARMWMEMPGVVQVGTAHEVTQEGHNAVANLDRRLFPFWIVNDDTLKVPEWVFTTGRPLPDAPKEGLVKAFPINADMARIPLIGTFGFAFPNKGFDRVISAVQDEFDEAVVYIHMTTAHFNGGYDGDFLRSYADYCLSLLKKPGIRIAITTDYKDDASLLHWLSVNDINCLFYDGGEGRGLSSAADYCIASGRPLLTTKSEQFRHITPLLGSYPEMTIGEAYRAGSGCVEALRGMWTAERLRGQYEGIVDRLLSGAATGTEARI